jgi:endonuclease I
MKKSFSLLIISLWVFCSSVYSQNPPSSQASNLLFFNQKPWQISLSFLTTQAQGYLVVKNLSGVAPNPSGTYKRGDRIGDSKVLAFGSGSIHTDMEVLGGIVYHYFVFAYNISGNQVFYNLNTPLAQSIRIPGKIDFSSYYAGINPNDTDFISKLSLKLKNHEVLNYSSFGFRLAEDVYTRDTSDNEKYIDCFYSNVPAIYSGSFSFQNSDFAREHVMPRSWMPTGGNTDSADGADYHNLILINHTQVNLPRSNYPFGNVSQVTSTFGEGTYGRDSQNNIVYEVRNEAKGNAARCIFYMQVAYNGNGGTHWGYTNLLTRGPNQSQNVLKNWHQLDPPDAFEITRHEYIAEAQKNRNPFIDFPHWTCYINFENMTYINDPDSNCLFVNNPLNVKILDISKLIKAYPNPSSGVFFIETGGLINHENVEVKIYNSQGGFLKNINIDTKEKIEIDISKNPQGVYWLRLKSGKYLANVKLIKM